MRIAEIAPLAEAVPPKLYGGTERVVSYLTEELVSLGHAVTLFASGDSETAAELVPITPQALRLDPAIRDWVAPHIVMLETVARRAAEFDIIHVHIDHMHLPLFAHRHLPFVTTLHGRLDLPEVVPLFELFHEAPFVSISDAQRRPLPFVRWAATIHHGLPADLLRLNRKPERYLAFLGRISPEKGPDRAIRIAERAGLPLKIAAKVDAADRAYFEAVIEPMLRQHAGRVEFIGEITERQKDEFLGNAAALLFPVDWPEPFGLVMIEAMACGTPVIAFDRGSVAEVLRDGVSGFIVADESGAVAAVERIGALDRAAVRAEFEQRFTARRMAEDYLRLYDAIARRDAASALAAAAG
jgi:glycosyltransferase involved in cell wall biosynthesis